MKIPKELKLRIGESENIHTFEIQEGKYMPFYYNYESENCIEIIQPYEENTDKELAKLEGLKNIESKMIIQTTLENLENFVELLKRKFIIESL